MAEAVSGKVKKSVRVDEATPLLSSPSSSPLSYQTSATPEQQQQQQLGGGSPRLIGVNDIQLTVFRRKYSGPLDKFLRSCKYGDVDTAESVVAQLTTEQLADDVEKVLDIEAYRRLNLKLLLHSRGADTLNGLQLACYYDQNGIAKYIIDVAREFLSPDEVKSILESKALSGKGTATALMLVSSIHTCRLLLDAGADKAAVDTIEMTPLHYAASSDNAGVVAVLLRYGADVNAQDKRGATALHWAVFEGYHYTAMMLVGSGADQSVQDAQVRGFPRSPLTCFPLLPPSLCPSCCSGLSLYAILPLHLSSLQSLC